MMRSKHIAFALIKYLKKELTGAAVVMTLKDIIEFVVIKYLEGLDGILALH